MPISELSESAQNHLKSIWALQEWSDEPVTTSAIAQRTGLKQSTVSGAISRLADLDLVEHAPYGEIALTPQGEVYATAMVRRHRLLETFLVQVLGYRWDEVDEEAEKLEHAVSEKLIDRIDAHLGRPTRDPHGDPIPPAAGAPTTIDAVRLSTVEPAGEWIVERIADDDPDLLRFFSSKNVAVGSRLRLEPGPPFSESVSVLLVESEQDFTLGHIAASAVWVSRAGANPGNAPGA